jgi:hypothetical protein
MYFGRFFKESSTEKKSSFSIKSTTIFHTLIFQYANRYTGLYRLILKAAHYLIITYYFFKFIF